MDAALLGVFLLGMGAAGIAATVYASLRLLHASRVVGEQTLILEAVSLLLYSAGLAVEAYGVFAAFMMPHAGWGPPPWARHSYYALGVELGPVIQSSLLAGYLYIASYAVHASGLYARAGVEAALLTSLILVYLDYNILALVLLTAICYALINIYRATVQALAYHAIVLTSHVLGVVAAATGGVTLLLPIAARSIAPIALIARRPGGAP